MRLCADWLKTYTHLVRNTEAPEHYWVWSGLYTLTAAMEKKVWVPYGLNDVYPNMYVILISPPGKCRKGGPIALSRKLLESVQISIAVDSTSPQALAKELADGHKTINLPGVGNIMQSPISINSSEFSSLLSVDAKGMIEFLTEGYDPREVWTHKVLSREEDKIYGNCISLFAATTPTWAANNLKYELFGAGFFSRVAFVVGTEKRKRIPRPTLSDDDAGLIKALTHDLNIISHLKGSFGWSDIGGKLFDNWYNKLDEKYAQVKDERFHGFIERAHHYVLKAAMALRVSYSDSLLFEPDDIGRAIDLVESLFPDLEKAFGGIGRNPEGLNIQDLIHQLHAYGEVSYATLLSKNWHNVSNEGLQKILEHLVEMKCITYKRDSFTQEVMIRWKGISEEKEKEK